MQEDKQQIRIDPEEIKLMRRVFHENDALLKAMRAIFYGFDVTKEERDMVESTFKEDEVYNAVRSRFYPVLTKDDEIGQASDAWLGVEQMVFGVPETTIKQAVAYKEIALDMTDRALKALRNADGYKVDLTPNANPFVDDPLQIGLLARNQFIRHIEGQLMFLKVLASQTDEDVEKLQEMNSSK